MLNYMVPWLKNIDLNTNNDNVFVMDILFRATIDYGTQYADQITKVWKGLTFKNDNIPIVLDYVLRRCEYDCEYDKWIAIEASKRIALYCSRRCRKYTIQHLIRIINKQSVDPNAFDDDDRINSELPEDPRTSLSTPAPTPYKRQNKMMIIQSPKQQIPLQQHPQLNNHHNDNNIGNVSIMSPMLTQKQLQFVENDELSDGPKIFADEIRKLNSNKDKAAIYLSISLGDYALMLLVELAYEMDPNDDDFTENLALMLHVAILGLDHPFRSLGEHCKRLLMNLIHSIHFKSQKSEKSAAAQELMLYLVSNRSKLMWQREMICPQQLFLASSRYLQFLVQWLIDVVTDEKCKNAAIFWGKAAIEWVEKCTSPFIACRSIQIYRSLQKSFCSKLNKEVFDVLMKILEDASKFSLWSEIMILMKTWCADIPSFDVDTWSRLILNTINICGCEPNIRPHVYIHALSLLASILQFLDFSNSKHGKIWKEVEAKLFADNKEFDGIQSFVIRGLLCNTTRKQSEEFLSGLTLMKEHQMISINAARIHMSVIAQLPSICYYLQNQSNVADIVIAKHMQNMSYSIASLFAKLKMREIAAPFENISDLDVAAFLSQILKPIAEWISLTECADISTVKVLLELLDHSDTEYRRQVLCILHGILLWIDWEESDLSNVDSNFFDRITDLLATNLWREATMILEVVVKFNNNSSESPSILFSPDPNIIVSPRKQLLTLDPCGNQLNDEQFVDYNPRSNHVSKSDKGEFAPSNISKDLPPFSPNNVKAKNLQQQRRKNLKYHQLQRRYSADDSSPSPILKKVHSAPSEGPNMASAAIASWQLVVTEARDQEYCSPLPQKEQQQKSQKFVTDLLHKSSIAFKSQKDEQKEDKPSFSARRSLDKLLSFSRLNSMKSNKSPSVNKSSFMNSCNGSNVQKNVTMVPQSRSESIDGNEQPGKAKSVKEDEIVNDENVNLENIPNDQSEKDKEENVNESIHVKSKRNRIKWNKEQIGKENLEQNDESNITDID